MSKPVIEENKYGEIMPKKTTSVHIPEEDYLYAKYNGLSLSDILVEEIRKRRKSNMSTADKIKYLENQIEKLSEELRNLEIIRSSEVQAELELAEFQRKKRFEIIVKQIKNDIYDEINKGASKEKIISDLNNAIIANPEISNELLSFKQEIMERLKV